ncbi:MAG: hypothetical protein WC391_05475 [Methanoregula sp.]|jgi:hypothetical protein
MRQNRVPTKIFINSYNDKNITLYGRRWNPDGSSYKKTSREETSREENRREKTSRKKGGHQEEMMQHSPIPFFSIFKKTFNESGDFRFFNRDVC